MRNRQRAQALPLKQICAPNLKGASVHHSSRRSLCFAFLFSFLENQAARECGRRRASRVSNRTRRGPKKMRPWNDTQAKAHGTKPSVEPQDEMLKSVQNWPRVWHFFRTSAAKPASPSLQLNIPQVDSLRRYARFLLHLKNTTFEAHFEQIQEPARKTPQRKKARVARCAAQQWLE